MKNNMSMKKIVFIFLLINFIFPVYASTIQGGVSEQGLGQTNRIIDKQTGNGIGGAKITLPKQNYQTKTDKNGYFELDTTFDGTTIMSVQKENYRPFSMTINQKSLSEPLTVTIEKSNSHDLSIDVNLHHLGDNSYSERSANAGEFQSEAAGPFFTKDFYLRNVNTSKPVYLVIGSIIGIDTMMARSVGQNRYPTSFASPPEVYFNGKKISEIQINGDGQKIKIPPSLIKKNQKNEVTLRTGRNLMQTAYVDYDDIEFMNLFIEN